MIDVVMGLTWQQVPCHVETLNGAGERLSSNRSLSVVAYRFLMLRPVDLSVSAGHCLQLVGDSTAQAVQLP